MRARSVAALAIAIAAVFGGGRLVAAGAKPLAGGCVVTIAAGGHPVTVDLADLSGHFAELDARLARGLTVTLVHDVDAGDGRRFKFGCKAFYDLWDEAYVVTALTGDDEAEGASKRLKHFDASAAPCGEAPLPWALTAGATVDVMSALDPVSPEQAEKTRRWLAEKGIGGSAGAPFGRAALALVDLSHQDRFARQCPVRSAR
jgi:hypothetical protein